MKPLAIMATYNRLSETQRCLESFAPYFGFMNLKVVDNGSEREMADWLHDYVAVHPAVELVRLETNIGCPRALNVGLSRREPGQPVLKIDNDVLLESSPHWIADLDDLEAITDGAGKPLAMISAYYEPWQQQRVVTQGEYKGQPFFHIQPVVGHCVWHTSAFMDQVGYFDVLAPDHLYGFEDLLMSHKATCLDMGMVAWQGWRIANIQRQSAIGTREQRDAHVETMRPLYNARASAISREHIYTGPDGAQL